MTELEAASDAVLARLTRAPGFAAAAFFDGFGVCVAARGDARITAALVESGRQLLASLPEDTSDARFRGELPLAARHLRDATLIVVGEPDVDLGAGDAHFHLSCAALALRAKSSSRPPPLA